MTLTDTSTNISESDTHEINLAITETAKSFVPNLAEDVFRQSDGMPSSYNNLHVDPVSGFMYGIASNTLDRASHVINTARAVRYGERLPSRDLEKDLIVAVGSCVIERLKGANALSVRDTVISEAKKYYENKETPETFRKIEDSGMLDMLADMWFPRLTYRCADYYLWELARDKEPRFRPGKYPPRERHMVKTGKNLWRTVEDILPENIYIENPHKNLFSNLGWKSYWIARQAILPILNLTILEIAETDQPADFMDETEIPIFAALESYTLDEFFTLPWRKFKHRSKQNFDIAHRYRYDLIPPEWEDHENTKQHIDECELCVQKRRS